MHSTHATGSSIFDRLESDVRSYCRHFPDTFVSGKGAWLTTDDGRKVLDFLCGASSLNYGHNDPPIMAEVIDYMTAEGIVMSLDLHTRSKEKFLVDLESVILRPRGLNYKVQFSGPAGTNAVEAALKLARRVTGRRVIAAFERGFHGMSLGSLAVTSSRTARAAAGVPLDNVVFWPYEADPASGIDTIALIGDQLAGQPVEDRPAAVIVELVQGDGGLRCASAAWIRRLAEVCRDHQVLLIVDDIQAGCGRTGSFFSFEHMGIVPDIVLLSKSLSGFGAPLSVLLLRPELDLWRPGEHTGTFRGNNLAFVGASAAFQTYWRDDTFSRRIVEKAEHVRQALTALAATFPKIIDVRGRGLITGLEFANPDVASIISRRLFERGIMIETCGDHGQTLKLLPPLNIEDDDLAFALEEICKVAADACKGVSGLS